MRAAKLGFGAAALIMAVIGLFWWTKMPSGPMAAFPQIFMLSATMPVLFYFLTVLPRPTAKKTAGIISCVIWIVGIGLAFLIPPTSAYINVPDAMLMIGFFPLLFVWKYSWPWIVFGILNFGIGILLMVIQYSPDNLFPADLLKPKHHLADYHPATVWYVTGFLATAFGIGRLVKNIVLMIQRRTVKSSASSAEPQAPSS